MTDKAIPELEEFNFDKWQSGDYPVVYTRQGAEVNELEYHENGHSYALCGTVKGWTGWADHTLWSKEGKYFIHMSHHMNDLMLPVQHALPIQQKESNDAVGVDILDLDRRLKEAEETIKSLVICVVGNDVGCDAIKDYFKAKKHFDSVSEKYIFDKRGDRK